VLVTLVGKPECHLCDDARAVVASICDETGTTWEERSILDEPELAAEYWEQIPVVLIDGERFDFWRIDATRLRSRLTAS
jgi:hypothetical protein